MTAARPVASRSPDRTGVCCAGRSAPSQCGVVTGPGFSSPNQPDQERTTAYHDSSGPDSQSDAHSAIIVGGWDKPSGESRLSYILHRRPNDRTRSLNDLFWLSFSRMIVTKHAGASLAWDISHSRPHKVRTSNKYDVESGFLRAVETVAGILHADVLPRNGRIYEDDSRRLVRVRRSSIDAIFSSPPYLNAIDYLRGHKFSLVWMGYGIPELRSLRSKTVGAERALDHSSEFSNGWIRVCKVT